LSTLDRFITAQSGGVHERALAEIRAGSKRSHWMWFVFPQIAGLGRSETARFFAIADRHEATDFLDHRVLGPRLVEVTKAVSAWADRKSAEEIFGAIDAIKLRSSMTLFEHVGEEPAPFAAVLDAFFGGDRDTATLCLLSAP
jgi:uncharacterized protein (DUF1810 family)